MDIKEALRIVIDNVEVNGDYNIERATSYTPSGFDAKLYTLTNNSRKNYDDNKSSKTTPSSTGSSTLER